MFYSKAFEIRHIRTNTVQETLVREEYHSNISQKGLLCHRKYITQKKKKFALLK